MELDAEVVKLYCIIPPIAKLDNSLNNLKNCTQLSLSTNSIDRLAMILRVAEQLRGETSEGVRGVRVP